MIDALRELIAIRGTPAHLRCDNGPEFIAHAVKDWLETSKIGPLYIEGNGANRKARKHLKYAWQGVFDDLTAKDVVSSGKTLAGEKLALALARSVLGAMASRSLSEYDPLVKDAFRGFEPAACG